MDIYDRSFKKLPLSLQQMINCYNGKSATDNYKLLQEYIEELIQETRNKQREQQEQKKFEEELDKKIKSVADEVFLSLSKG